MSVIDQISYLLENQLYFFGLGLAATIVLSLVGTIVGLLLGIFLALGKNLKITSRDIWISRIGKGLIIGFCNIYSTVIRGTPMMVQAMLFKYGCQAVGINWNLVLYGVPVFDGWLVAGLIVITFNTAAYMGEIIRSGFNGVDKGQIEGAKSLGMSSFQSLFLVVLPQAIRNSLPTIGNEWIVNIKDSSVLNVIGVSELFFMAGQAANKGYMYMGTYVIIAVIYLCLTLATAGFLKFVEYKMDGKKFKVSFFHFNRKRA